MSSCSQLQPNRGRTLPTGEEKYPVFPTLQKSLSTASSTGSPLNTPSRSRSYSWDTSAAAQKSFEAPETVIHEPPLALGVPATSAAIEVACVALHYLPTPILILSSLKTVVMANEAMGRLLGLDVVEHRDILDKDEEDELAGTDLLRGLSLSQIGIEIVPREEHLSISWEVWLWSTFLSSEAARADLVHRFSWTDWLTTVGINPTLVRKEMKKMTQVPTTVDMKRIHMYPQCPPSLKPASKVPRTTHSQGSIMPTLSYTKPRLKFW